MSDKMREEFEAWAVSKKDEYKIPLFTQKNSIGKYIDRDTEISWQAWQASRAALVVEIPNMPYYDFDVFKLKDELDAVGVSCVFVDCKPDGMEV